jgi:SAM-dependent methyltransferase
VPPRERGLSFGAVAETYDRFRPPYLAALLDRAQEVLALTADARILDLGAGTGRLTRELAKRFASVVAVEPDEEMRALIDVGTVLAGTAEAIPVDSGSFDAVYAGEAFHWFDTQRAVAEIARVLAPGGGLAIVSTHWWETDPPLPETAERPFRRALERFPSRPATDWDAFVASPFEPLREEPFEEELTVDADTLLAMYSTVSSTASLGDMERAELLARVRPLLVGPYRLPLKHTLRWTRLRA